MAVPPLVAAQLAAKYGPKVAEKIGEEAKKIGASLREQFGLTAEQEYVGVRLAMVLLLELYELRLKAPLQVLGHIELQVAGVLEQLYSFLGGVGNAVDKGAGSVEASLGSAVSTIEGDVVGGATAAYDWLVSL